MLFAVASMLAGRDVLAAPGDLDPGFGVGGKLVVAFADPGPDSATALARDAAGNLYVGGKGHRAFAGGSADLAIAKLDQSGQLVSSFGTGGTRIVDVGPNTAGYAEAMAVDANGNLFLAGGILILPSVDYALAVTQIDSTGAIVSGFGTGGTSTIPTPGFSSTYTARVPDGTGGVHLAATRHALSATSIALYRLGPNGQPVNGFGTGGRVLVNFTGNHDEVHGLARAANGELHLAGTMLDFSNVSRIGVAKPSANGVLASGYGTAGKVMLGLPNHGLEAFAMALAPGGTVYVVGVDESVTPEYVDALVAALGSAGTIDTGFGNGGSTHIAFSDGNDFGRAALLDGNGHLVVAGYADGSSVFSHFGIARLLVPRPDLIFRSGFEP